MLILYRINIIIININNLLVFWAFLGTILNTQYPLSNDFFMLSQGDRSLHLGGFHKLYNKLERLHCVIGAFLKETQLPFSTWALDL